MKQSISVKSIKLKNEIRTRMLHHEVCLLWSNPPVRASLKEIVRRREDERMQPDNSQRITWIQRTFRNFQFAKCKWNVFNLIYLVWGSALLGEMKWDLSPCHHCQRWIGSEVRDANKHSTPKSFSFVQAVKHCGSCKNSLSPDRGVPPLFYSLKTSEVPSYQEKSHF